MIRRKTVEAALYNHCPLKKERDDEEVFGIAKAGRRLSKQVPVG